MMGWQRHMQSLVRQVATRYVCSHSASFSTFNRAKTSLNEINLINKCGISSLRGLRNSFYPTTSRSLFQHMQKLEFTSSRILLGPEGKKSSKAQANSKGKKKRYTGSTNKKSRFLKQRKGRVKGISSQGNHICFGTFGLQALEPARITSRQIEAGRRAMTRNASRGVKVWVRLIADKTVTSKPAETRMGRGKGAIEYSVAAVKPGRILYEMGGVTETVAKKAIVIASSKMPIQTRFVVLR